MIEIFIYFIYFILFVKTAFKPKKKNIYKNFMYI